MLVFMAFLIGLVFVVFGHWGLHSPSGQQMFPEMAGMIPELIQIAGYLLLGVALVVPLVLGIFFKRGRRRDTACSNASSYWKKGRTDEEFRIEKKLQTSKQLKS